MILYLMSCHRLKMGRFGILHIILIGINAMLLTHIYKRGNPNTVACTKCIPELPFALSYIVFLTETADGLKNDESIIPKIGESKSPLGPVVK